MKKILMHLLLVSLLVLVFTISSTAENSEDFAILANETWSAFECSVLAENSKNSEEQERLFLFGYKQGLRFIDALKSNKTNGKEAPWGMLLRLQGPTPDFMLGRVFEGASESAWELIKQDGLIQNAEELRELAAENEFRKRNCKLIGRKNKSQP